ncbi:hypothetical protein HIM_01926 [Hirsutella minnesotensis 3608]|nr:hypothetical protein HIM_01926 [Hirsutella minnesotensis 3608]
MVPRSHARPDRAEAFGSEPPDLDLRLWEVLSRSAAHFPHREALVSCWQPTEHGSQTFSSASLPLCGSSPSSRYLRWTYQVLLEKAEHLAQVLTQLGCVRGMRVAAILKNSAEWALWFWAAMKLGMTFAPIDPRSNKADVEAMFSIFSPDILVVQDLDTVRNLDFEGQKAKNHHIRVHCSTQSHSGWLSLNQLGQTSIKQSSQKPVAVPVSNRWLVHTPVSHIFAINNALRAWRGGDVVVFPSASFDVRATAQALAREKCTVMSATPTLVKALHANMDMNGASGLGLSMVTIAGTCIRPDDMALCRRTLSAKDVVQAYGMSEGGPLISWQRRDPLLSDGTHSGVGKILPGAAVRICIPGTMQVVKRGEMGELHVSGASVISGYLAGRDESFYSDSMGTWLVTGDRGMMTEEGVVYLDGRQNDLIIRGGENIHPAAIEISLEKDLGLQACVVGVPDEVAGQIAVAVVSSLKSSSTAQIMSTARELGPRCALDAVYTLSELGMDKMPTTMLGKPKRCLLRKAVVQLRAKPKVQSFTRDLELERLTTSLENAWKDLTGNLPSREEQMGSVLDSISLLRYCDAVSRRSGRRLYLQDLTQHNTIEKQARLLLGRDVSKAVPTCQAVGLPQETRERGSGTAIPSPIALYREQPDDVCKAAITKLASLGLSKCRAEDYIPIKASFQGMVTGQRPRSFQIRVVFQVAKYGEPQVRQALHKGLALWPILRTISCSTLDRTPFHIVVAAHRQFFDRQVKEILVKTDKDAQDAYSNETCSRESTLMFIADIITVKENGQCYLAMTYNHSIVDAVFLIEWHQHLAQLIREPQLSTMKSGSSYHLWMDLFRQFQDSAPARTSVDFHVRRLRGISRLKRSLWPPQKAPGWMIADDAAAPCADARRKIRDRVWHGRWEDCASEFRYPRRSRIVCLPSLPKLRQGHGISPALFARCAVAIFNIIQTASPYAVFTAWESGRSWPFVPPWMHALLPPAASIDGPTAERILNIVETVEGETVLEFFGRMARELEQATLHEHAPWDKVVDELKEEGRFAAEASSRQSFVWDVSIAMPLAQQSDGDAVLHPVARHDWADFGFCWNMFLASPENMLFIASWDTAQMNAQEVEEHCETMAHVMRRLACEENWVKLVSDVVGGRNTGSTGLD